MNDKKWKILGGILIGLLLVAVIVTSVLISNKKKASQQIPDAAQIVSFVDD